MTCPDSPNFQPQGPGEASPGFAESPRPETTTRRCAASDWPEKLLGFRV